MTRHTQKKATRLKTKGTVQNTVFQSVNVFFKENGLAILKLLYANTRVEQLSKCIVEPGFMLVEKEVEINKGGR